MQNTDVRQEMVCPLNGVLCVGGRRADFTAVDKAGNKIECRWWVHMFGKDPQSEKIYDQFDCAVAWLPTTTIEGSQMTRQMTATVDALRSEIHANLKETAVALFRAGLEFKDQKPGNTGNGTKLIQ